MPSIPEGFEALEPYGEFGEAIGPIYGRMGDGCTALGMHVAPKHCSKLKIVHGGMLASLIDTALAVASRRHCAPSQSLVTTSLTIDYIGSAVIGDWLEAKVDVLRAGSRVIFLACHVFSDGRLVARASGQFLVFQRGQPALATDHHA